MSYTYEYPRAALTADAVIIAEQEKDRRILLIKRGSDPFKNFWALPGGFVDIDEDIDDAVAREVEEETGLKLEGYKQLKAFGKPGRDPRHRTVTIAYVIFVDECFPVKGADDAIEAQWFPVDELPGLAFDHSEIINCAINSL